MARDLFEALALPVRKPDFHSCRFPAHLPLSRFAGRSQRRRENNITLSEEMEYHVLNRAPDVLEHEQHAKRRAFYERIGFMTLDPDQHPNRMFLPMKAIEVQINGISPTSILQNHEYRGIIQILRNDRSVIISTVVNTGPRCRARTGAYRSLCQSS
ncbi:MAG: hypothetical protein OXD29_10885 [Roseovarius sp.]|nr:hypothetical protein [Roseovarius sp.]